ncbi:retrotransposon protein, putative, ty1-copia subclass [Tanacetum coccineum]
MNESESVELPQKQSFANVVNGTANIRPMKKAMEHKFENTLVGFFVGKKVAFPLVKNYVTNTWAKFGFEKIMSDKDGVFYFKFSSKNGVEQVLEQGPWLIRNVPLILTKWSPNLSLSKDKLKDEVIMAIPKGVEENAGHTLVKINIEYEWKPPICLDCRVFGHANEKCPKKLDEITTIVDPNSGTGEDDYFKKVEIQDTLYTEETDSEVEEGLNRAPKQSEVRHVVNENQLSVCDILESYPWILMGDFNVALNLKDYLAGPSCLNSAMNDFKACVNKIEVMDINSTGLHYTWNQKPRSGGGVLKKLNRIMGNLKFVESFPGAYGAFQPYRLLDHSPTVLKIPTLMWSMNVEAYSMYRVVTRLKALKKLLRKLLHSHDLCEEEAAYISTFIDAKLDEERFLKQKAKIEWLEVGDSNSAFFYKSVKSRNQRSRIDSIRDADDSELMGSLVADYFVNDYRPISCCNVLYKCISKILTNRIINGIKEVVSENQFAFIPGKRILDNILLTQELIHNYHRNRGPPRCAFKVDIQKAYDTVDWKFLENILKYFRFHNMMIKWIMACGDPISPYLFTLVMEVLTLMIKHRVRMSDTFRYHNRCEELKLVNVCFADDLFIFTRGDVDSALLIMESLDEFQKCSGLVPSIPKGTEYFCNVRNHIKLDIMSFMPFAEGELLVKYLEVPLISSRLLNRDCKVLVEKVSNRIGDWKNKSLSFVGRLKLCRSVLYFMWDVQCPFIQYLTPRAIMSEGFTLRTCVAELVSSEGWLWPQSWLLKAPNNGLMHIPRLEVMKMDIMQWRDSNGVFSKFSVKGAWEALRPQGMDMIALCLQDIITVLQPMVHRRNAKSVIGRLLVAAASYFIWKEQNNYVFKNVRRSPEELRDSIIVTVRFKLLTFCFKNTAMFVKNRGFFEKQKITGSNFIDWYRQLRIVLSVEDKLDYLKQPIPPAYVPAQARQQVAPEALAAHVAWMLQELKTLFAQQVEQELLQTVRDFYSCKQEGQSISSYILKIMSYIDNLERLGHLVSLKLGESLILISLQKEFNSFVQNYNMHGMGKTVNELHAMLKLHEKTLPKKDAPALHVIQAGKGLMGSRKLKPGALRAWDNRHRSPFYKPQHNGVSKRRNRTLLDMVRSMMSQTTLPNSFWDYALKTAARIPNMVPTKKVEKSAYEVMDGQALSCPTLYIVWGMGNLFKRDILTKPDKLEPRSIKCIFVGYPKEIIDHMCLYVDVEEHELGDLGEPANYKAVLLDPRFDKWLNAMNVEMQSMKDNEVWVLVDLPPDGKTVGSKWLFKKKTDIDGAVHTYKAHLPVKGFTQTYGVDYEETFSHVAKIRVIRILIAIAAFNDYEIWQMDVKTAFLNGHLLEEVYMEQHEGFVNPKYPNQVCKLKRSIYGLKQASRQGNKQFDDEIKKFGFTQNRNEPCVYLKASESNVIFQILYVDDILIMGNNIPMLQDVKSYLERFHVENSKRGSIPMQEKLKFSKSQGASTPAELKRMQNVPYASAVGSIMYAMRCTRLDVAFAQSITSLFQLNSVGLYCTTVKNILKYLRNTKDMFLVYGGDIKRKLRVSCYTDAGYLTDDDDDLKSQTGYVYVLNRGVVDWKSTKQSIFATSSAEAEYIAAYNASKEAVWVRKFISGLGVVPTIEEPIKMYCDNNGEIAIANESGITKGARHFHDKVHLPS